MFRAGHCICREYHNPDEHEHFEDEEHIPDYTWVSTCKSRDGGELVKKNVKRHQEYRPFKIFCASWH